MALVATRFRNNKSSSRSARSVHTYSNGNREFYDREYARYEDSEADIRRPFLAKKKIGKEYLKMNFERVNTLPDGMYKSFCALSEDGLMDITVQGNKVVGVSFNGQTISADQLVEEKTLLNNELNKLNLRKASVVGMDKEQITLLAEDFSKYNTMVLQSPTNITEYYKSVPPELVEQRRNEAMSKLKKGGYEIHTGPLVKGDKYYRFCPQATDGIGMLIFNGDNFTQTYKTENGNITDSIQTNEPLWHRGAYSSLFGNSAFKAGTKRKRNKRKSRRSYA